MAYLSLYRKYRPQTFADVMGQDHVVQTLQNALRYGHVANGYLFCGTRGVAKTTLARILAKCLNCIGADGNAQSPQSEPCNQCKPCLAIQAGGNVDVVEMDAASNRSVADIARLRENVQFGPMESRYKVYIVDEAHQLTSDAKDAFLKTLEEPPSNVVFILATTESHAIPITIASRCQQFDFRRGSIQQIADQCAKVLSAEGVEMPTDAIAIVARAAEGSYRDALSLLDQVLSYKRVGITSSDVAGALGTVEGEMIDRVLDSVISRDQAALFALADDIYLQGKDVRNFLRALSVRLRDLFYVKSGATSPNLLESGIDLGAATSLAAQFGANQLIRALEIATEADRQIRHSDQHRLLLEMTLLKLTSLESMAVETSHQAPTPPVQKPARTPIPTKPVELELVNTSREIPPPTIQRPTQSASSESRQESYTPPFEGDDTAILARLRQLWPELINFMQAKYPKGVEFVRKASPKSVSDKTIVLEFENKADVEMLQKPARREAIEKAIARIIGHHEGAFAIKCVVIEQTPLISLPSDPKPFVDDEDSDSSPVLDEVLKVFGGRIIEED